MAAVAGKRSVPSPVLVKAPVPVMGASHTKVEPVPTLIPPPPAPSERLAPVTVSEPSRRKIEPLSREIEVVDGSETGNPPG